jgi:hypothetical protein
MSQGAAKTLTGRLLKSAKDVVDVADVEPSVFGCDFVGAPPARFVLHDPHALLGGKLVERHECRA